MTKRRSLGVTFGLVTMVVGCGATDDQDEIRMSVAKIAPANLVYRAYRIPKQWVARHIEH